MRRRLAVGIEYDGRAYCGWQQQCDAASVQLALEQALSRVADEPIGVICAGRTDAGVHARQQVVHFDTHAARSPRAWLLGANSHLPRDISLRWAQVVPEDFHARFSALARSYRYLILNRVTRSALADGRALVVHQPLDLEAMQAGAQWLIGEHDFSAFRSSECQAHSAVRQLRSLRVARSGDWIAIDVTANAFLHHMVRNIVGLLLAIGQQRAAPERAREQLASRARSSGEATAAAHGLYLWRVDYAAQFGLPADSAMIEPSILGWP
ncbi:MAG TPA: tRNA pseudouridine(38-40) synthase TruA [Steroidobacteraceae bacterium]|nr:tRNA pseudouridine(38-40) synthase TruA [Steroidobacteraceae bacterium]